MYVTASLCSSPACRTVASSVNREFGDIDKFISGLHPQFFTLDSNVSTLT